MVLPVRILGALALVAVIAGCGTHSTSYEDGIEASVARGWTVSDVVVTVPETLTVSEERTYVPAADIVWREDPVSGSLQQIFSQRREQVARIMRDATLQGAAPLDGETPVRLVIEMERFHAMTFEAEWRAVDSGVHDIDFTIAVVDARTGAVLAGPERIEAAVPAFSGPRAVSARAQGQTQKSVISTHVAETVAGWLGVGPDNRGSFRRLGV